jgi:cysteinyl-tRNA synthetase
MGALGVLAPDIEPRATEYISGMIAMIETLIGKGYAYVPATEAPGHVLFDVGKMAEYGRLSRLPKDELIAGARVDVAPYKRNAEDFILGSHRHLIRPVGTAPGAAGGPAGTLNARSWPRLT